MSELDAIDRWLLAVLSGDGTLTGLVSTRIYDTLAPQGATMPYVVYQNQAGHDVRGVGPSRIMADVLYVVKAVCEGTSFTPVRAIADRIDTLLQGASGSNVDGTVLACVRESPFSMIETTDGKQYRWRGGVYRLWAQ